MNRYRSLVTRMTLGSALLTATSTALAWPSCSHPRMTAGPDGDQAPASGRSAEHAEGLRGLPGDRLLIPGRAYPAPGSGQANVGKSELGGTLIAPEQRRWRM